MMGDEPQTHEDLFLHKFRGCMLSLAIGDALGRPVEFLESLKAIRERHGPNGVSDFEADWHPPGTYTDDTQMSLCVARAIVRAGHRPLDDFMEVMAAEFVAWSRAPENDRAPGVTCMNACERLEQGVPRREAGAAESKGCGSAMRTAPIGLFWFDDPAKLVEIARASALPTHGHPTALAAAAATALLVAWTVRGDDPAAYPARLAEAMTEIDGGEVAGRVERIPDLLDSAPDEVLHAGCLGEAWVGEEAVACALYCILPEPGRLPGDRTDGRQHRGRLRQHRLHSRSDQRCLQRRRGDPAALARGS